MDVGEARTIGARARMIRRRRGLSLEVVAGLAGITAAYLSLLERGLRGFNRRGLIEDLAEPGSDPHLGPPGQAPGVGAGQPA